MNAAKITLDLWSVGFGALLYVAWCFIKGVRHALRRPPSEAQSDPGSTRPDPGLREPHRKR